MGFVPNNARTRAEVFGIIPSLTLFSAPEYDKRHLPKQTQKVTLNITLKDNEELDP